MMNTQLQLEPPSPDFVSPLLELRDYYAHLVEEYESLYIQARSKLDHVQALLSDWPADVQSKAQISAAKVTPQLSPSSPAEHSEFSQADINISDNREIKAAAVVVDHNEYPSPKITAESIKGIDFPMLPEYKSMSRMDAIQKVLHQHLGAVCHIDFIVRALYGELDPHIFKVVKGRVQSSLTQGRERQAWFAIPDEPGCYTLDLSLVSSNLTHTYSRNPKSRKKPTTVISSNKIVPMLKAYEGQFLIDALTSFFRQHPGKVFSVAQVIAELYGDIDAEDIKEVKSKVLNELSRGYRIGRFDRIPDKVGFYTLDTQLVG